MFETIVIPIGPGGHVRPALRPATALADACGADLILVGQPPSIELHRLELARRIRGRVTPLYLAAEEDQVAVVARIAARLGALIATPTHARGRIGHALFGSTAEALVRAKVGPVLLIGPNVDPRWEPGPSPVVVPLDGGQAAEQAMALACEWSTGFGGPLNLIRADHAPVGRNRCQSGLVPSRESGLVPSHLGPELPHPPMVAASHRGEGPRPVPDPGETYLQGKANLLRVRGFEVSPVSRQGHGPAAVIADHIDRVEPNLVAMVTRCRGGLTRLVGGSTTMAVAHRAPCPVMAQAIDERPAIPAGRPSRLRTTATPERVAVTRPAARATAVPSTRAG